MKQAKNEFREEAGSHAGRFKKVLGLYSHPDDVAHRVYLLVAYDLEWDMFVVEVGEEIRVHAITFNEALMATKVDYRFDTEAALAIWLYVGGKLSGNS